MTNNLKEEIENTLTVLTSADRENELRWRRDEIDTAELMELRESTKREATESILALINQKEKELLEKVEELDSMHKEFYRSHYNFVVTDSEYKEMTYKMARDDLRYELKDRIKQLKEELKGGKD